MSGILVWCTCHFMSRGYLDFYIRDDFLVKTTEQLLNLCTACKDDPHYKEAIHFCYSYLIDAMAGDAAWGAAIGGAVGATGGFLYGKHKESVNKAYQQGYQQRQRTGY